MIVLPNFVLTCCSTADLPAEYFVAREIPYVCFHVQLNGAEYFDDLGQSIAFPAFYQAIQNGAMPTTSQVNVEEFIAFFEPLLAAGQDVLHLSFSSGLSGSYQSACIARDELAGRYPARTLLVVDSLGASSGYGLLVDTVATLRDKGCSAQEAYDWAMARRLEVHHWFFSGDLSHYKRGGRISATAAVLGGLLGICPLMNMNHEGKLIPRTKIRGKNNVIKAMAEKMRQHAQGGTAYSGKCFISHSACEADARAVAKLVEATFPQLDGPVMINSVGTVIGAHTGPGTVALFFFGDPRVD